MYSGPTEVMEQVDREVATARRRAEEAHAVRLRIDAVRGRATSRAGDVTVEVDSGGAVVTLDLAAAALQRRPDQLSSAIVQTMRQAQQQVAGQISSLAAETFGETSSTTARIQGEVRAKFVPPDEPDDARSGISWGAR